MLGMDGLSPSALPMLPLPLPLPLPLNAIKCRENQKNSLLLPGNGVLAGK